MNSPAIIVKGLSVTLGGTEVLRDVSFECAQGEFLAVVGKSGVGKTTLLNALAGFVPYAGRIVRPERVGYVFQDHALFPWMTVEGNVVFGLEGMPHADRRKRAAEMLERVGLADLRRRYPHELSGGQMQRVALARTLAPDPALILMDEPYAALDQHTREDMQEWLLTIWQDDRKTIVFVTHSVDEAIYLADRAIILGNHALVDDLEIPLPRPRNAGIRLSGTLLDVRRLILSRMHASWVGH